MTELIKFMTTAGGQQAQGTQNPASMLLMLIPLVLMIVIFYFLIIRPEKKRSKKMKEMLDHLEVADEVVTAAEFSVSRRTPFLSKPAATGPR